MPATQQIRHLLVPRAAFAGLPFTPTAGGGVTASDRDGLGLATVQVRQGQTEALAGKLREVFRLELPQGTRRTFAGSVAFMGTGPGAWLATCEKEGNAFATLLQQELAGVAAVSDQSDGQAVLRVAGPRVRDTLGKLVPIDLHPRAFKVGDVAGTVSAHIGTTLWRLEDAPEGSPVFEVALFRSLAASFWHALVESAAEYGFSVAPTA